MSLYDDPDFRRFAKEVEDDLIPKLTDTSAVISLVPEGETDIKYAIELGLSIMLDKPIVAVVKPGVRVPPKLAKVVDHWVEADISTEAGRAKLAETINALLKRLNEEEG